LDDDREILLLREFEHLSYQEIADVSDAAQYSQDRSVQPLIIADVRT